MGGLGAHPQTGQPQSPRDVAHLHLLVSSIRVGISISQRLLLPIMWKKHVILTQKTLQPRVDMLRVLKQHQKFTEMDVLRRKGDAPTNINVLKQRLRRNQFFNQLKGAKEGLD